MCENIVQPVYIILEINNIPNTRQEEKKVLIKRNECYVCEEKVYPVSFMFSDH